MSWEWIGTAALGLTGLATTYLTARQGRQQARDAAKKQNEHELRMAYEQRQQQRRAEAYVELLTIVEEVSNWARKLVSSAEASEDPPELPSSSRQARASALTNAYGSSEALASYGDWRQSVQDVYNGYTEVMNAGIDEVGNSQQKVHDLREKEDAAKAKLVETVSSELAGAQRVTGAFSAALNPAVEPGSR